MASLLAHASVALAMAPFFPRQQLPRKFWLFGVLASILPDIDFFGFRHGIPYSHVWGHRGLTHSVFFALLGSVLLWRMASKLCTKPHGSVLMAGYFFLCLLSHGLLDALTDGGLGVAFFSPFETTRHFFSFRPIRVSPLSVKAFLSAKGLTVLQNEIRWVFLPALGMFALGWLLQSLQERFKKSSF